MLGKTAELLARKTAGIASPQENITKPARHKSQSVLSVQEQPKPGCVASSGTVPARKLLCISVSNCGRNGGSRV